MAGRIDEALGAIDGANRDFATPAAYAPGTLIVFLNGQQLKRELDNGWDEVDPSAGTFRMKLAPQPAPPGAIDHPGDVLFTYYDTGASVSVGGAQTGGIPLMAGAEVVKPGFAGAVEIRPGMVAAADRAVEAGVPVTGAEEVRPDLRTAEDLRPKMVNAREE